MGRFAEDGQSISSSTSCASSATIEGYEQIMREIGPIGKWQYKIMLLIFLPGIYAGNYGDQWP